MLAGAYAGDGQNPLDDIISYHDLISDAGCRRHAGVPDVKIFTGRISTTVYNLPDRGGIYGQDRSGKNTQSDSNHSGGAAAFSSRDGHPAEVVAGGQGSGRIRVGQNVGRSAR